MITFSLLARSLGAVPLSRGPYRHDGDVSGTDTSLILLLLEEQGEGRVQVRKMERWWWQRRVVLCCGRRRRLAMKRMLYTHGYAAWGIESERDLGMGKIGFFG
jgi:hypothetical protein